MRTAHRARPQVLTLEGRPLLSATSAAVPAAAAHVESRPTPRIDVELNGYSTDMVVVDKASVAHVTGKGHFSGLGHVTVTSTVNTKSETPLLQSTPWLIYADLMIGTPKGQIDVHVTPGTIGLNPFAQPFHMQYAIHGGTGVYRHAYGKGLVDLTVDQPIPTTLSGLKALGTQVDTKGVAFSLHFHPGKLNKFGDFSSMWYGIIQGLEHKSSSPAKLHHHVKTKS